MHRKIVQRLDDIADAIGWVLWIGGLIALIITANIHAQELYSWVAAGMAFKGLLVINRSWLLQQFREGFPFLYRGWVLWE